MQTDSHYRPTGVTIIAILNIIGGIVMVVAGISLVTFGALMPMMPMTGAGMYGLSSALVGAGSAAIGAIVLALGIASFVVAYGLLKGLGWAWTLTVVLAVASIVLNAISVASGNFGGIISIIISAVILYYMYRPHVKAYFGKATTGSSTVAA